MLVAEVGVADVGFSKGSADQGFDHRGIEADGDVTADSPLGPVADGRQVQEVFEDPEFGFGGRELTVPGHGLGGGDLSRCEAGGEHVTADE